MMYINVEVFVREANLMRLTQHEYHPQLISWSREAGHDEVILEDDEVS